MSEFIETKISTAKAFRIALLIIAILWMGSFLIMPHLEFEVYYPIVMLLTTAVITCWIIYLVAYLPFTSSVKWLKSRGLENVADDIILERPTLPRSKIFCGQRALFSKKPCALIPYAEIAWVHLYERRMYGIAVEKAVIIYTKDGKKFSLNANADEFRWLLEKYIIPSSPNIVIGYGAAQKARYKQLNPEAVNAAKKVKRIWGIVLMILGAVLLTVGLINQTIIGPGLVIVLGMLGAGVALFLVGKRK